MFISLVLCEQNFVCENHGTVELELKYIRALYCAVYLFSLSRKEKKKERKKEKTNPPPKKNKNNNPTTTSRERSIKY